jgi:hypothetical protein
MKKKTQSPTPLTLACYKKQACANNNQGRNAPAKAERI